MSVPQNNREHAYRQLGKALAELFGLVLLEQELKLAHQLTADLPGIRLYRLDQVAEILGLGQTSVKALLGRELEVVHQGRAVMVPSDSVEAYIARLRAREGNRVQGEGVEPVSLKRRSQRLQRTQREAASSD